jgi:CheY-like chemotaxis protein
MSSITSISTILLIDDDQDDCYLFTDAIKNFLPNINLVTVNNFLEAIAYLTSEQPDIIFLDLNMPFKSGIESLAELKADQNFKTIPIVVFSNSDYPKDIKLSYEKGAALYFTKPSSFDDLLVGLQQILNKDWTRPAIITAKQFIEGKYEAFTLEATS